ncbi:helix-turn-helix domain-containing protein [Streptomyces sp. NPDC094034]|uniref:helix-turn-helix domain-containing protein n=1 Tax=Streptomyces sp. NPDC094034 TaxID=3155309 RepID=UPI003331D092
MIETVFRTDEVPSRHRFDAFREKMIKVHAPAYFASAHANDFSAEMRLVQLGQLLVWPATVQPSRMWRTPRQIRQSDPEQYHLTLMLRGAKRCALTGREFGPYEMHMTDTSRPYSLDVVGDRGEVGLIGVEFPKALVPFPLDTVGRLVDRPLPGAEGIGALLANYLTSLSRHTDSYRPADTPRLETVLTDLFSAVLAHHLDAETMLPPEAHQRTLLLRIRSFIRGRLHDPELTPATIAAAHHISIGYLHRLFRLDDETTTLAAWIRHQRLEAARRDLADPAQRSVPVHHIGRRWGFSQHAAFTRAFRSAYGIPPRDYRQAAGEFAQTQSLVASQQVSSGKGSPPPPPVSP